VAEAIANAPNGEVVRAYVQTVADGQLALYERTGAVPPWIGYLGRDEETGEVLGSCSFIGDPAGGSLEIAYFTFPPYEGAGVATAMAQKLVAIAVSSGNPDLHAFTLPEENASSRILRQLGFSQVGEANDDEAGIVWRWERSSKAYT
jgi:RimJ/RimL family protein N-acetyltransferase